jgi:hypothetical protein
MPESTQKGSIQEDRGFVLSKIAIRRLVFRSLCTPWAIIFNLQLSQLLLLIFHLILLQCMFGIVIRTQASPAEMTMFFYNFANDFCIWESPKRHENDFCGNSVIFFHIYAERYFRFNILNLHALSLVKGWVWKSSSACLLYHTVGHRVDRVLSAFSSRANWDFPTPHIHAGEYVSPPLVPEGGHTRLRERGWARPNSDEGTDTVVL